MPLPLSYPGLRCVLENLEAVKRAHIIARSPGLQKVDKLIPLCLENLSIGSQVLDINKLSIMCDKDEVNFYMNGKTFSRQQSEKQGDRAKKLINFYICGRSIIRVHKSDWSQYLHPDFLPADLKLRVNSLKAYYREVFEAAISLMDPRSFPLKTVVTDPDPSHFESEIIKSAETLILNFCDDWMVTVEDLKKLNNKTVVFEHFCSKIDMVSLIEYQVDTRKVVETTFVISTGNKYFLRERLRQLEQAFGEYRSDLDDVNERFFPESPKFSIPINNESRIQVYAIEEPERDRPYKIIAKPVSGL